MASGVSSERFSCVARAVRRRMSSSSGTSSSRTLLRRWPRSPSVSSTSSAWAAVRGKPSKTAPSLASGFASSSLMRLKITASGTSLPSSMYFFACAPSGVFSFTAARRMSPVVILGRLRRSARILPWVPLPDPGAPRRRTNKGSAPEPHAAGAEAGPAACGSGADPLFVLLLCAPGSGEGTQGKIVAERLGLPKITTGDILREAVKAGTPLGVQAKKYMDDGKLVPDAVILSLIKEELAKPEAKEGAIFDGFPRTAAQAELVDTTLGERGQRLSKVLLLDVPEEELIRRLTARATQENRSDDTPEAIRTRLQVYQRDTAPLVAHY